MTALPFRPIAETADTVTLRRADFETMRDMLEDARDIADIDALAGSLDRGETEAFPADLVDRLLAGERPLRVFRGHRGLTQDRLAELAGLSLSELRAIEDGTQRPSVTMLTRLAQALAVPPDLLVQHRPTDA